MLGCIKKPVEIGRIVQNANIAIWRGFPADERQKSPRIAFQDTTVLIDLLQDCRGHWEMDSGGG
jgi:hypothetical protein